MKALDINALAQVTGGLSKTSALTTSLGAIQSSISDLSNTNNQSSSSSLLLPIMMMAMNRQRSPSVVSAGGATIVA